MSRIEQDGFYDLLVHSKEFYSQHEINGNVYLVLRDSYYSNGLIPPVVIWVFNEQSLLLEHHRARSHAHALEWLDEIRQQAA